MESPRISDLVFLSKEGKEHTQPPEWREGWIELQTSTGERGAADLLESARAWRNGEPLEPMLLRIGSRTCLVFPWRFANPGHYRVQASLGQVVFEQIFTVQPNKITRDEFTLLLADLQESLPALVALGIRRCGGLVALEIHPPTQNTLRQEIERLRRAVAGTTTRPGLAAILPRLQRAPHRILAHRSTWLPRRLARRPHPVGLHVGLRYPDNIDEETLPKRVLDSRVEHTADVYENRLVRAFVRQVDLRLRRVQREVSADEYLHAKVSALSHSLAAARRQAPFLDEVTDITHLTPRTTMVLLKVPPYRASLEGFLELNRSLRVRLEQQDLQAPLDNLPRLYELWCSLQVHLAVLDLAQALGFRVAQASLIQRDDEGLFVQLVPGNSPTLELRRNDIIMRVLWQRCYSRLAGGTRSISFDQKPDVVVEIARDGQIPCVLIFDAKYKVDDTGLLKEDIDKMHAYRDAVRCGRQHVVAFAGILYLGETWTFGSDDIGALRARPGDGSVKAAIAGVLERVVRPLVAE